MSFEDEVEDIAVTDGESKMELRDDEVNLDMIRRIIEMVPSLSVEQPIGTYDLEEEEYQQSLAWEKQVRDEGVKVVAGLVKEGTIPMGQEEMYKAYIAGITTAEINELL